MSNLYIPKRIKIGFNNRSDTYTGKLAYVVYFDDKNILRQEKSWSGWRDHNIPAVEYDNAPTRFVLNKGVHRQGYFGSGRNVIRVYDTRDFEFEITVDNLMGILMHSDVSKRDIMEECVFAWSGKDLVLLPVNSDEYKQAVEYTSRQAIKLSAKELVPGHSYQMKKEDTVCVYIGKYDWFECKANDSEKYFASIGKKYIFWNGDSFMYYDVARFSNVVSDAVDIDFANKVQEFLESRHASPITRIIERPVTAGNDDYSITVHLKHNDNYFRFNYSMSSYYREDALEYKFSPPSSGYHVSMDADRTVFRTIESDFWTRSSRYLQNVSSSYKAIEQEFKSKAKQFDIDINNLTVRQVVRILNACGFINITFENKYGNSVPVYFY